MIPTPAGTLTSSPGAPFAHLHAFLGEGFAAHAHQHTCIIFRAGTERSSALMYRPHQHPRAPVALQINLLPSSDEFTRCVADEQEGRNVLAAIFKRIGDKAQSNKVAGVWHARRVALSRPCNAPHTQARGARGLVAAVGRVGPGRMVAYTWAPTRSQLATAAGLWT